MNSKKRGFLILDLIVGTALAVIALGVLISMCYSLKFQFLFLKRSEISGDLAQLANEIAGKARVSDSCQKTSSPLALQCSVTLNNGTTGTVQFRWDPANLQIFYEAAPLGGTFSTRILYKNVTSFVLCDVNDMTAGNCPLKNASLNTVDATRTLSNRFFRFQILSDSTPGSSLQSSFFVRNPGFLPGVTYQFGGGL